MLSAIAARKAAQAAKLASASPSHPSRSKNVSSSEHDSDSGSECHETILRTQKPKRKSSEATNFDKSIRNKRRKKNPIVQGRYYEPDIGNAEDLVRDEGSSSSSSDSDADVREVRFEDGKLEEVVQSSQPRKRRRTWSPSRPPPDSSDDELDPSNLDVPQPPFSTFSIHGSPLSQDAGYQTTQRLSFVPQPDKNVFSLKRPDPSFLSGRKGTLVALAENETMALVGVYSLTVLRGTVSLMGTDLLASASKSYAIFAPRCSPIPILKVMPCSRASSPSLPDRIARAVSPNTVILFFEDMSTGIEGLGQVCKIFEDTFEASSHGETILNLSSAKLMSSLPRSMQPFRLPNSWHNAISALSSISPNELDHEENPQATEPLALLVKGQKRTGKSTLARTLVNRLVCRYRRVAYLECDIGQTEFSPPGLVSLHIIDRPVFGPPFTHPRLPYASHFIGASSPRNNPEYYIAAVSALVQTFKLEIQYPAPEDEPFESDSEDDRIADVVPLVVNTMGWLKGLGADLARQIEELVAPTYIFSMQSPSTGTDGVFPSKTMGSAVHFYGQSLRPQTFEVEAISPGPQSTRYSAADWRTISLMSYFFSVPSPAQYELLPARIQPSSYTSYEHRTPLCIWDCRLPLVAQAPFVVSPADAIDDIVLVGAGMEDVVPTEIARVLNGAIVALVSCETDLAESPSHVNRRSRLPYTQGSPAPDPSMSNCIGLALIRGVSPSLLESPAEPEQTSESKNDTLQLLTPLPPALIAAAMTRCFVKGEIELPVWGMLDHREFQHDDSRPREINTVPYLQWSKGDAVGAERRRVRRNIMRKGQM